MLMARVLVLCFLASMVEFGLGQNSSNYESDNSDYISWDDFKVDLSRDSVSKTEIKGQQNWNSSGIIVVDSSGQTGDSVTVQGAVDMVPDGNTHRVKILILPGIYRERVVVPRSKPYISFIGQENQASNTVITWNNKASDKNSDGVELGTSGSATVAIFSDYFCASDVTFENTVIAIPGWYGMQAVALRVSAEKAMFYKVNILGAQDTLLDETGSHYFYQCLIQGSIDFIFGNAKSLYQFYFKNPEFCSSFDSKSIWGDSSTPSEFIRRRHWVFFLELYDQWYRKDILGRAWGPYSRAIYSYCDIDDIIAPAGWSDWGHPERQITAVFGEFQCRGKGAATSRRVPWAKSFNIEDARPFLDMEFIDGNKWLRL